MSEVAKLHKALNLDEYGLLVNPDEWNESMAIMLARLNGIDVLTNDHWKIILALREHYSKFGVAPTMHNICREYGHRSSWVHDLFDSCLNAWRIAGLPDPGEEAKAYMNDM